MRHFCLKVFAFWGIIGIIILLTNYWIDPANIVHFGIVDKMSKELQEGKIIVFPGDFDEGLFQEEMISSMDHNYNTVIVGSSHIMFEPWEFDDYYIAGLSGAYLGDYYAIAGLLDYYHCMPSKMIIGVDPWAFMRDVENGRHSSLLQYVLYEQQVIERKNQNIIDPKIKRITLTKLKELLSLSYFHSSLEQVKKKGIEYYLYRDVIQICDNSDVGLDYKILPSGRKIFPQRMFMTVEENNKSAQQMIDDNNVYQLNSGFSELQYEQLDEFEKLLVHLKEENVTVEIYLHPWYPSLYNYFRDNTQFGGVLKTEDYLRNMCDRNNIVIHGSFNPEEVGVSEEDFADWLHLSPEKMLYTYNIVLDNNVDQ